MIMRVNRVQLLQALQTVQPGLSSREIVEQSNCFVFQNGEVLTYNDEIACRMATPLHADLTGAVQAAPLLTILGRMQEEELEIHLSEGEFLVVGKKRRAGIRMESEITLPISTAEKPAEEWIPLHEHFIDAIKIVQECAGRDDSKFALTCIHLHPKWIEACDNFQMSRYKLLTGVREKCLIRKDSIKHIVSLEMVEFNETQTWIHFRNHSGLVLSCRRYLEDFPDLKPLIAFTGSPAHLPRGLSEAAENAAVFSSENADDNQVRVDLKDRKLRIKGVGNSGWYAEYKQLKYDGPDIVFYIAPKLLIELTRKHHECEISSERLKVNGGRWVYVTCLGAPPEEPAEQGS